MENRLITEQLAEQIAKYPLYSQDGLGKAAICIGIYCCPLKLFEPKN